MFFIVAYFFLFNRWSKSRYLRQLKIIGYRESLASNTVLKKKLKLLAPNHMSEPKLDSGIYASNKGLYVHWCATKKIKQGEIVCWSYRKAEMDGSEAVENWWQAIYFNNSNVKSKNEFQKMARIYIKDNLEVIDEPFSLLLIFERRALNISNVISLLRLNNGI